MVVKIAALEARHTPLVGPVLDLVLSEVVLGSGDGCQGKDGECCQRYPSQLPSGASVFSVSGKSASASTVIHTTTP